MTAAEAVLYGPEAFNDWIDSKVRNHSRRHRAQMSRGWLFSQPVIATTRMLRTWVSRNPRKAAAILSGVVAVIMLWKVSTR